VNGALLFLAFLAGALLAVQAAANVQLNRAVNSPTGAAALQLGLAAALLAVLAGGLGTLAALGRLGAVAPWHLGGGVASALYIAAGIVLFPRLGALVSVGLFISGQVLASLVLDGLGLLGLAREAVSVGTLLGALGVIAGMVIVVRAQPAPAGPSRPVRGRLPLVGLGLLAGAGLPVQAAVNARLRTDLEAPFAAATVSFLVATVSMLAVLAVLVVTGRTTPTASGLAAMPWWGWLGALVGAAYVTVSLLAVPAVGAAPTVALTVAGQQIASAVVDHNGMLRLPRRPVTRARLLGVGTLLAGAVLIQLT
jgi:transporter family-2 protein